MDEVAQLIAEMHLRGINVRYLAHIHERLTHDLAKRLVLTEAIARTIKHEIEECWRHEEGADQAPFVQVLVQHYALCAHAIQCFY